VLLFVFGKSFAEIRLKI